MHNWRAGKVLQAIPVSLFAQLSPRDDTLDRGGVVVGGTVVLALDAKKAAIEVIDGTVVEVVMVEVDLVVGRIVVDVVAGTKPRWF